MNQDLLRVKHAKFEKTAVYVLFVFIFLGYLWSIAYEEYFYPFEPNTQFSRKFEVSPLALFELKAFDENENDRGAIKINHFFFPYSREHLWEAMCELTRRGKGLDNLLDELKENYKLKKTYYKEPLPFQLAGFKYEVSYWKLKDWVSYKRGGELIGKDKSERKYIDGVVKEGVYLNEKMHKHCR